jgi:Putative MetA-pathway of phenol degradation
MIAGPRLASSICGSPRIIGIGHGVTNAGVSYTYFIPFSGVARLYSFENQRTTYQNGVDMRFDWGASQFLTKQFQVGLVCYVYKEIGCDSGSAEPLINRQGQAFKSFGKDRFQARLHIALDSSKVSGSLRTCPPGPNRDRAPSPTHRCQECE